MVFLPRPRDGAKQIENESITLKWVAARNAISHNVYFGNNPTPKFRRNQKITSFISGKLKIKTVYYWRVDEVTETGTLRGPLWHFTTN
jgi:hypothetical protein